MLIVAIIAATVVLLARILVNRHPSQAVAPAELRQIEERLARIERAVDTIAVETERISEGQRFVTKIMADRGAGQLSAPSPGPDRVGT